MDRDDEDLVFYGTPIEREEEITTRKKKSVAESAGLMRSLPSWKQEVRDEEGRRRFHGAFTGGFSAGYYNTAGSKEGWTPQTFTSSRKSRAEVKEQNILSFLDDDEKAEMEGQSLGTSMKFDTFGFTAAEFARKEAEKEQQKRPSAIPGPVPDDLVVPATNSIGVNLLLKMGWRHGHSISDSRTNSLYDVRREARKAFLAFSSDDTKSPLTQSESAQVQSNESEHGRAIEQSVDNDAFTSQSTPVFVVNPKQDLHGLGYDPFKHAPEFRESKKLRISGNQESGTRKSTSMAKNLFKSGKVAPGFGIGALEELDTEDDDIYASGFDFEETIVQEIEEPSRMIIDPKQKLLKNEQGVLPGFKAASSSDYQLERFSPPVIPSGFEPHHKFPASINIRNNLTGSPPPEVPPPDDNSLRLMIDGFSTLVARCGKLFEDLSREKNKSNPLFCFLNKGKGDGYYKRKVWEEQQKRHGQAEQQVDLKLVPSVQKMTAETRGKVLGEKPLERRTKDSSSSLAPSNVITHIELNLSDTFTKPASLSEIPEAAKPFKVDPAKQERFERFLREKYQGGLRSTDAGGSSHMSETDRAHERLDFEAAAEAIGKVGLDPLTKKNQQLLEISVRGNMQFTSGGLEQTKVPEEQLMKKMYPKREDYEWRPSSLLCKRFDIIDPYIGKAPPLPRARSRMDSFIFTSDFVKSTNCEEPVAPNGESVHLFQLEAHQPQQTREQSINEESGIEIGNISVERPVDLYKAIFSDDSEGEEDSFNNNQVVEPLKKNEVANSTVNRLIAGDFLESLGKELGLEVPPEPSVKVTKVDSDVMETNTTSIGNVKIPSGNNIHLNAVKALNGRPLEGVHFGVSHPEIAREVTIDGNEIPHTPVLGKYSANPVKFVPEKMVSEGENNKLRSRQHQSHSGTVSSEDEASRKRQRRNRSRSTSPSGTDSSGHCGYKRYSSSKLDKKGSSRGKSGSRKHSKYHRSRSKDSPNRYSRHGSTKRQKEDGEERRKSRDQEKDRGRKSDSRRK
ncbi:hypothetical protein GIB67_036247 [Kingdonia uniflora]|uniref:SURP motif domain-containing protein n=1 Tax=Kingdonia uniflora TaxID=39325 RepID=A0A7J7NTQ2_9MAGN|nr:hypothetical protein GIB67_036247 [Kingdonia uniflora]